MSRWWGTPLPRQPATPGPQPPVKAGPGGAAAAPAGQPLRRPMDRLPQRQKHLPLRRTTLPKTPRTPMKAATVTRPRRAAALVPHGPATAGAAPAAEAPAPAPASSRRVAMGTSGLNLPVATPTEAGLAAPARLPQPSLCWRPGRAGRAPRHRHRPPGAVSGVPAEGPAWSTSLLWDPARCWSPPATPAARLQSWRAGN